jgi:hypothetical protein
MTRKSNKSNPFYPTKEDGTQVNTNVSSEKKNVPRFSHVEIFTAIQPDGSEVTAGIFDGVATLLWFDLYRKMGLNKDHAKKIPERLDEGKHYIELTKEEIKRDYPTVAKLASLNPRATSLFFLTEEGWYRAIQDIGTGSMNNKEIAANIDRLKDEMASIFARYKRGEVLSLKGDTSKQIPKYVPGAGILRDRLRQSQTYQRYTGCSKEEATLLCLKIADEDHKRLGGSGFEALIAKTQEMYGDKCHVLPVPTGIYLSVIQIGKKLGVSGQAINKHLDKLGYQENDGAIHVPTDLGMSYAKAEDTTFLKPDGSTTTKVHWYWSREMVEILRVHIQAEQVTLPGVEV